MVSYIISHFNDLGFVVMLLPSAKTTGTCSIYNKWLNFRGGGKFSFLRYWGSWHNCDMCNPHVMKYRLSNTTWP